MKRSEFSVPLLDLAPRLKRPLSLWNPLDYLRLLYWALFFPQAVLWYLENFGKAEYIIMEPENIGETFRKDIVLRNLFIQALITLIVISFALAKGLSALGLPIYRFVMWSGVFFIFITSGFMLIREDFDNMICMADVLGRGVMLGMILGVSFGIMYGVLKGMESRESVGMTFGIISGVGMGGAIGITFDTVIFIRSGLIFSRISSLVAIEMISLLLVMIICDIFNAAVGVGYFVGLNIVFGVIALRFTDFLLVLPSVLFWTLQGGRGKLRIVSHDVVLSLPGIKKQLKKWLIQDWEAGVYNVNQMLDYSRQFGKMFLM